MHATAGSIIGVGEIVLLPLDVLKIKRQTNPEAFRGRGLIRIISDEGFGLYRGWGWTAARNAPGSFAVRSPKGCSGRSHPTDMTTAVWWLCRCQGIPLQAHRLQHCFLDAKLCRINRWCHRLACCLSASGRYQDPNSEQEFREPRERVQDRVQHDEARRFRLILQGTHSQASNDRTKARLLLLVGADAHSCVWQDNVI